MEKIIFIDLDGTLTPQSTWYDLNMILGVTPDENKALFERYLNGNLLYNDWTAELVRLHKEHDSVHKDDFVALAKAVELRPDAQETVVLLKEKGYRTILISGSVDVIVETIAKKLGFDAWLACTKVMFDQNGVFTNFISTGDESPAKVFLAKKYCEENGINLADAIVVGDGGNEKDLFEIAKGILLGSNVKLKSLAWKHVNSLSEISALL